MDIKDLQRGDIVIAQFGHGYSKFRVVYFFQDGSFSLKMLWPYGIFLESHELETRKWRFVRHGIHWYIKNLLKGRGTQGK